MISFYPVFFWRVLICLTILFGGTEFAYARHIVGGEIFYTCMGPGSGTDTRNYRLTMKLYRDCQGNGASFDNPARFGIYSYINGVYTFVRVISVEHGNITNIEAVENPCLILPSNVCVQEASYIINLTNLPIISGSYIASWQRCCRNNTINNIVAPHNTGATYTIEITEEAQRTCNSGPRFNEFPPIGICVNEAFDFDHSANDAEGDQLIYEFCAPLAGGGPLGVNDPGQVDLCEGITPDPRNCLPPYSDVVFNAPTYSALNPLGVSSSMSIHPQTGFITGNPNLAGQFVVGICVKEFRNGVLLSVLRRDFQFNVVNCQSSVEASIRADAIVNEKEFIVNSCGSNEVTFINESQIEANIDSYLWSFDINGVEHTSNVRHPTFTFPDLGTYTGMMIINEGQQCGDTAFLRVHVYPAIDADFEFDYDTCIGGPVNFTDLSSTGATELKEWNWDFGDNEKVNVRNPDHLYQIPGLHPVTLIVKDNNECRDTMVKNINYFPVPPLLIVKPSRNIACTPENIVFSNLSVPIDETYDIIWDFGDGSVGHEISPVHEYEMVGIHTVSLEIRSPIGCFTSAIFPDLIEIEASPTAGFIMTPEVINSLNPTATFTDLSSGGAAGWYWDFCGEGRSFNQSPTYTFRDTGICDITQVVFHPNGCTDTLVKTIDIESIVQFFLPNAFTPNYDGKNEVYKPEGISLGASSYSLTIWSRWGEELFTTTDPEAGWNGRKNNTGQEMPVGVYLCVLQYKDARKRPHEMREFVTLIR